MRLIAPIGPDEPREQNSMTAYFWSGLRLRVSIMFTCQRHFVGVQVFLPRVSNSRIYVTFRK